MAWGSRNFASLIGVEWSINNDVDGVYYNLSDSFAIHRVFKVQLLLNVDLTLNCIIFNLIIDDVVKDVLVLQTESEAAVWASFFWFNLNIASFLKRTTLNVSKISLVGLGNDLNVFIPVRKLEFDQWCHFEDHLLFFCTVKVNMVENINLERLSISYL